MIHPLLRHRQVIVPWIGIWTIVIGVQFLTLFYSAGFPLTYSIADSLLSGFTYIIISLGLWFTVRFGIQNIRNPFNLLLKNIMLFVSTTLIWISTVWGLLIIINYDFGVFYKETILFYRIIASLMFYISTVVVYFAISFYETLQQKQANEMQLKTLVKEAQLNELRSQLHPHFLFNSLNSINSLTITNPKKAGEMIINLSEFLRYSLGRKGHSMTTFEKELYHVNLYLDIEKIRFGDKLEFVCQKENVTADLPIPLMLLQPLIENSVKHGVYNSDHKVTIKLEAKVHNDDLLIIISNNFDPDAVPEKGTGTGLTNVKDRIQLVYGSSALFETHMGTDYFIASLKLPIKNKHK